MKSKIKESLSRTSWSNLPVKITVLVFWGLALFGSAIAVWMLSDLEHKLAESYEANSDRVAYQLDKYLHNNPPYSFSGLQTESDRLRKTLALRGIEIGIDQWVLISGETGSGLSVRLRELNITDVNKSKTPHHVAISIYFPSL